MDQYLEKVYDAAVRHIKSVVDGNEDLLPFTIVLKTIDKEPEIVIHSAKSDEYEAELHKLLRRMVKVKPDAVLIGHEAREVDPSTDHMVNVIKLTTASKTGEAYEYFIRWDSEAEDTNEPIWLNYAGSTPLARVISGQPSSVGNKKALQEVSITKRLFIVILTIVITFAVMFLIGWFVIEL